MTKLGATGKFPGGKISKDDAGELRMAIGLNPNTGLIEMRFGQPIAWFAMDHEVAINMAANLINAATAAARLADRALAEAPDKKN